MGWRTRWEEYFFKIEQLSSRTRKDQTGRRTGGRILENYTIRGRSLGNCVFISQFAPNLGKPVFFNTQSREYVGPVAGGSRQKLKSLEIPLGG